MPDAAAHDGADAAKNIKTKRQSQSAVGVFFVSDEEGNDKNHVRVRWGTSGIKLLALAGCDGGSGQPAALAPAAAASAAAPEHKFIDTKKNRKNW
ncbi:MAG: hypothetical protein ACYC4S_15635 [Rhodoferax sp.]